MEQHAVRTRGTVVFLLLLGVGGYGRSLAADWPMWRCDAARSGASPEALPAELHLQWSRQVPPPQPAWPDEPRLAFDWAAEPVAAGATLFVPSSASDSLTALDIETGQERWRFYAEGPVRFPAAAWEGRVYLVSDDGYLYCLDGANGKLLWKHRGGPDDRRLLGNGRLISAWPARGGPVTAGGRVYFAAGIWPSMGVFVHALDAATGRVLWTNDTSGSQWTEQPHGGGAPNGPAPQGCLALAGDKGTGTRGEGRGARENAREAEPSGLAPPASGLRLLVPCGRTYPAVFDARDGRLLAWQMGSREDVGCQVVAAGRYFFAGALCGFGDGDAFQTLRPEGYRLPIVADGILYRSTFNLVPLDPEAILCHRPADPSAGTEAMDLTGGKWNTETRGGRETKTFAFPSSWRLPGFRAEIKAGNRLYGTLPLPKASDLREGIRPSSLPKVPDLREGIVSEVAAVDLPDAAGVPRVSWRARIQGHPLTMLAASGKLVVVTAEGMIYCFGGKASQPVAHPLPSRALETHGKADAAKQMLDAAGTEPGWGVVLGVADGQIVEELLRQSQLHLVAIDADERKIDALRRRWDEAGLYGRRVAAIACDPLKLPLPCYMARLITSEDPKLAGFDSGAEFARHVFAALRPFGGVACLALSSSQQTQLTSWVGPFRLPETSTSRIGDLAVMKREGPLPGSANWTHEFADAANTRMAPDGLVKGPFGPLWFGGELANHLVFAKTLVPATPPIVDGRMFIQGPGAIRAVDIYTGTILWTHRFDDNKERRSVTFDRGDWRVTYKPPAGGSRDYSKMKRVGYNCVAVPDAVYLACGPECLRLDPATGQERSKLTVTGDDGRPLYWDTLRVAEAGGPRDEAGALRLFGLPLDPRPSGLAPGPPSGDVLVATAISPDVPTSGYGFTRDELGLLRKEFQGTDHYRNLEAIPANYLIGLDRQTEKVLWRRKARHAFLGGQCTWHLWGAQSYQDSTIAVGGGRVFCLDMLPGDILAAMKRRGVEPSLTPQLAALDVRSGRVVWEQPVERFSSLAYSREFDVLVETGAKQMSARGQGFSGEGITARKGSDGSLLWKADNLEGPVVLHHRTIHANGPALDLLTGAKALIKHPLTDEPIPWGYPRGYGCGLPLGGEHLLTFRSGTAAYYDLTADSGTVYMVGMRAGCVNSFIPAGGILNAPNYAYGCACNFQNDTSMAFVTTPDAGGAGVPPASRQDACSTADAWASISLPPITQPVRRIGLNLGAACARRAENGTLWVPCPEGICGPARVRGETEPLRPFRWHPSQVDGEGLRWVAASGIDGVRKITIDLRPAEGPPLPYTVSIQFIEPQPAAPGDRVFDIALQGAVVAKDFDIVAQAGRARRAVLRKWSGIPVRRQLEIAFIPKPGSRLPHAAVSGVEIQAEPH